MYRICQVVLKVASRCNLNCTYCYVYNKGDLTWRNQPGLMSDAVFSAALGRIAEYCEAFNSKFLSVGFHGGEPCLIGVQKFDKWCKAIRRALAGIDVSLTIQTNATLLTSEWTSAIVENHVKVGVSLDGLPEHHDEHRRDRKGRPSYDRTMGGIALLRDAGIEFGLICVIPLGADPLLVHKHLSATGAHEIRYLFPDFTHNTFPKTLLGQTPCADFLIELFDDWVATNGNGPKVTNLWNISRVILGADSRDEAIGNQPPGYLFVDADGTLGGLDVLSICEPGLPSIGKSVFETSFIDIDPTQFMGAKSAIFGQRVPKTCQNCPEAQTCAGGHLPHRYDKTNGFDNPSVWCGDLFKLFRHVRSRLKVENDETASLRSLYSRAEQGLSASSAAN